MEQKIYVFLKDDPMRHRGPSSGTLISGWSMWYGLKGPSGQRISDKEVAEKIERLCKYARHPIYIATGIGLIVISSAGVPNPNGIYMGMLYITTGFVYGTVDIASRGNAHKIPGLLQLKIMVLKIMGKAVAEANKSVYKETR